MWIDIEQMFAILVKQRGLLTGKFRLHLNHVTMLILAATKLHNYCLNQRFSDFDDKSASFDAEIKSFY